MANCVDADHRVNELRGGNGRRYRKVPDEIEDFFFIIGLGFSSTLI